MYDFLRIACACPKVKPADIDFNFEEISKKLAEAKELNADITVFPELCLTGYTCQDLFLSAGLLNGALLSLRKLVSLSKDYSGLIAAGAPLKIDGALYNCAVYILNGKVAGITPKTYLPNYGEFYEKRWFSSSEELKRDFISSYELFLEGDYDIPLSSKLVLNVGGEYTVGAEICEDVWTPLPPSTALCLSGAEVILNLSASNETISKRAYRTSLIKNRSASLFCAYAYCSAGAGESTTDLVYSGHSMICENGRALKETQSLITEEALIVSDVDLGKIRHDRIKNKSFSDCAKINSIDGVLTAFVPYSSKINADGSLYPIEKLPFVPSSRENRAARCRDIFDMQVYGLKKRLETVGAKAVIGVSGGLDSTLALLVAYKAIKLMGRPACDVIGITLPCFGTTNRTHDNAVKLMKELNITSREINIKEACLTHYRDIGHDKDVFDLTFENTQARERTQVLMDYAGKIGGIVVGTGDLSELALGWCTYNADHMSMYGVNASIPKTLVRWMIEQASKDEAFSACKDTLADIMDTPISPELLPPDADGKIAQKTESIVGPYALHDFFLYYVLRYGFEPAKIFHLAKKAFRGDFTDETILKWLKSFYRRFFTQQFKRSCLPDGVKVGSVCLSPRGDWRMPSDASAAYFLSLCEKLTAK